MIHRLSILLLALTLVGATGCIRRFAINKLGDALASSGTTFSSDDDPEFIADATPFSLKLIESLLAESPKHGGLLTAAASGFTQYAYAFLQQPADEAESTDLARATHLRGRARRMFFRARDYGLRGLSLKKADLRKALDADPAAALSFTTKREVPLLYWTAAAWVSAISLSKDDPAVTIDQPIVQAMIDRALQLDESFDFGAIHLFLVSYESARIGGGADSAARITKHYERALALSQGKTAAPLVAYAEAMPLTPQNKKQFMALLEKAIALDGNQMPEKRLANMIAQQRARWLLSRVNELFVE